MKINVLLIYGILLLQRTTDSKYSAWNEWSPCSIRCGKGTSTRERITKLSTCYSELRESKECEVKCPSGRNFAKNKNVRSSSTFLASFPRTNVVDGNKNVDFYDGKSCFMTDKDKKPWIQIDLQEIRDVEEVILYNRGDCCQSRLNNVRVTVGLNRVGRKNQICGIRENMKNANSAKIRCLETLRGRHVHISVPGPQYLTLCEVEVMGKGIIKELAHKKPATSSTLQHRAPSALDGNLGSFADTQDIRHSWWRMDLQKLAIIYKVRLYAHSSSSRDVGSGVKVGMTTNTSKMRECGLFQISQRKKRGSYYAYDLTCKTAITGRYVRVSNNNNRISLAMREFHVYGYYL